MVWGWWNVKSASSDLRPRQADSEKITINLGYVDLGHIDLMVQDGFYSNRTDFIRTAIRNLEIEHLGNPAGFVTLSAGVDALAPVRGAAEPTKLIHAADKALYMAKAGGRNRVCTSSDAVPL